jgi:hypothetical protein
MIQKIFFTIFSPPAFYILLAMMCGGVGLFGFFSQLYSEMDNY